MAAEGESESLLLSTKTGITTGAELQALVQAAIGKTSSDATLAVSVPASALSQSAESIASYSVVVAKKGLSVAIDQVRVVMLQFGNREPE